MTRLSFVKFISSFSKKISRFKKSIAVETTKNEKCVFPFTYNGVMFYDCTKWGGSKAWCSLTGNYDKDKKWGYCNSVDTTECSGEIQRFQFQYSNLLLEKFILERKGNFV